MARTVNNILENNDDIQFWMDIMPELVETSSKSKGKVAQKANVKKEVRAIIDAGEGVGAVKERKQNSWQIIVPFRGTTFRGFNDKLFSKKDEEQIKCEILDNYIGNNKYISTEQQAKVIERINKNVDIKMYKILRDFDISNYWETNKSQEYVNAMVKNVKFKRKKNDSARQLAKKEDAARRKELRNAGIVLNYDLRNLVFNKNNPVDNIEVLINALKHRRFAELKFLGFTLNPENKRITRPKTIASNKLLKSKKKEKQIVPLKLKKLEKAKKYIAKESLIKRFQNRVNEINWGQTVRRGLVTAGVIGLIGVAGYAGLKDNNIQEPPVKEIVTVMDMDEMFNVKNDNIVKEDVLNIESTVDINNSNENKENGVAVENTNKAPDIVENNSNVVEDIELPEEVGEEKVVLQDALLEILDLGFGTEFSVSSGRYYEAPGKTGRSGGFSNISKNVQINYVDAIENGNYHKYTINEGMSISDIKEAHPNAELSYHVITDSTALGWVDAKDIDIENNLVKGALMELKSYLSPEIMEFLCNNDLKGEVSSSEFAKYASELEAAQAKMQENNNLEVSTKER